ncbi:MAG TPA: glycosyltransferase family A protein, partial [Rubrobacter sp.]|nr:glycosyltransferase family A protein [Rubrobacter sp.]
MTLNAGPGFGELLRRLFSQKADFGYEVLVIDSGSTDATVELARSYGASVHTIDRDEFDHGATRNLGASLSRGRYVAFVVQDALPIDEEWLAAMVEDLEKDGTVAGVYGRQIPRP